YTHYPLSTSFSNFDEARPSIFVESWNATPILVLYKLILAAAFRVSHQSPWLHWTRWWTEMNLDGNEAEPDVECGSIDLNDWWAKLAAKASNLGNLVQHK
ncbi:1961_t:CDS:2, partial [Acaulospora colombiana]